MEQSIAKDRARRSLIAMKLKKALQYISEARQYVSDEEILDMMDREWQSIGNMTKEAVKR